MTGVNDFLAGGYAAVFQTGTPVVHARQASMNRVSNWAARTSLATPSAGDWLVCEDTGFVARYSTAWGDWVPALAYAEGLTVDAQIGGTLDPDAETPAWTVNEQGSGAQTTAGGKVVFTSDGDDQASASFEHAAPGNHLLSGRVELSSPVAGPENHAWEVHDGSVRIQLSLANADEGARLQFLSGTTEIGLVTALAADTERWLFLAVLDLRVYVWLPEVAAEPVIAADRADFADASTDETYVVGDTSATGGGVMRLRSFQAGHYA